MYSITITFDDMARPRNSIPTLRHHKSSGQAFIVWDGKTIYLGDFGSFESVDSYQKIVSNLKNYGQAVVETTERVTIKALSKRYLDDLPNNYPKTSQEPKPIRRAIKFLVECEGELATDRFSAARFIELRQKWIERGLSVATISKYHGYILNLFRWAAIHEFVPASAWHALLTVPKLKPQRSAAKDPKIVNKVEWVDVEAVKPHVIDQVWDMVNLHWYSGMRSGEILNMTLDQITENVYRPRKHKNKWRGHVREVFLGPKAREIVNRYAAGKQPDELIFTGYSSSSYGRAITRACKKAGIKHWHPHQLRHAAADRARDAHGLDAAQALLGHKTANTTEIYAKVKRDLAKKASEELG